MLLHWLKTANNCKTKIKLSPNMCYSKESKTKEDDQAMMDGIAFKAYFTR